VTGAGYSGKPLRKKLGITDQSAVAILGPAPELSDVAASATTGPGERASLDVLLCFVTTKDELERGLDDWSNAIHPDGSIWICWPKKAARKLVPSNMTEDDVRGAALPMGLVDNKVCAINEIWSGLRLVWRVELRAARRATVGP
jgi:hypothetical protein